MRFDHFNGLNAVNRLFIFFFFNGLILFFRCYRILRWKSVYHSFMISTSLKNLLQYAWTATRLRRTPEVAVVNLRSYFCINVLNLCKDTIMTNVWCIFDCKQCMIWRQQEASACINKILTIALSTTYVVHTLISSL